MIDSYPSIFFAAGLLFCSSKSPHHRDRFFINLPGLFLLLADAPVAIGLRVLISCAQVEMSNSINPVQAVLYETKDWGIRIL